jgi:hypothetical protein
VGPCAIEGALNLLKREMTTGPKIAFDLFSPPSGAHGRVAGGCIFLFLTTIRLATVNATTLRGACPRINDPFVAAMAGLRQSFFIDRDLQNVAKPDLDAATKHCEIPGGSTKPFTQTYAEAKRYRRAP